MRRLAPYLAIVVILPALRVVLAYFSGDDWRVLLDGALWGFVALLAVVAALFDRAARYVDDWLPERWDSPLVRRLASRVSLAAYFLLGFVGWAYVSDGDWQALRDSALWVGFALGFGVPMIWDVIGHVSDRPPRLWGSPQ